jgi:hypothetical protein
MANVVESNQRFFRLGRAVYVELLEWCSEIRVLAQPAA